MQLRALKRLSATAIKTDLLKGTSHLYDYISEEILCSWQLNGSLMAKATGGGVEAVCKPIPEPSFQIIIES